MNCPISAKSIVLLAMASATFAAPAPARAGLLWYNGDYDGRTSLTNETNVPATNTDSPPIQKSLVYDNFVVPAGQIWSITSLFSNDLVAFAVAPTTATWQIRTGVSSGNGGTLVASGDTAATLTPIAGVSVSGYTAETVTAAVTTPVYLTAGTYWLAVAPDSAGYYADQAYVLTTSGANSVGSPGGNDGNSYITNTYPTSGTGAYNFTPTVTALSHHGSNPYGTTIDFSMGLGGFVVPEPSSVILVAVGLFGSLAFAKTRRASRDR